MLHSVAPFFLHTIRYTEQRSILSMPTYTFHCDACDVSSEQMLPLGTKTTPPCPSCSGITRKIIKPPMVHFKGSGFYKTDSSKSSMPAAKPAKPVEAKPAETKPADPKPATTTASAAPSNSTSAKS